MIFPFCSPPLPIINDQSLNANPALKFVVTADDCDKRCKNGKCIDKDRFCGKSSILNKTCNLKSDVFLFLYFSHFSIDHPNSIVLRNENRYMEVSYYNIDSEKLASKVRDL